jgi:hypothetical protein
LIGQQLRECITFTCPRSTIPNIWLSTEGIIIKQ